MKKICLVVLFGLVVVTAHAQTGGFNGPDGRELVSSLKVQEMTDGVNLRIEPATRSMSIPSGW
tara:strand:- start:4413 stop:4601 length:189 start_codon:yes stop_codon:yes gene_type:complete